MRPVALVFEHVHILRFVACLSQAPCQWLKTYRRKQKRLFRALRCALKGLLEPLLGRPQLFPKDLWSPCFPEPWPDLVRRSSLPETRQLRYDACPSHPELKQAALWVHVPSSRSQRGRLRWAQALPQKRALLSSELPVDPGISRPFC